MPGESPLNMMQAQGRAARKRSGPVRRRRLGPVLVALAIVIVVALAWVWLWYDAAAVADRTLAGWLEREAAAGRVYSCAAQAIGGFPLRIEARCADAAAEIRNNRPQFTARAKAVTFAAEVFNPTRLIGDVTGPLTLAERDKPPSLVANWSRARLTVRGRPPDPESVSVRLDTPRLDREAAPGAGAATLFTAERAELQGRMIAGSPRDNPVIEVVLRLAAATAPTLHPLTARPIEVDIDVVLRGLKNLAPKPWADRFREMQAAGGGIEIKSLRIARSDALVVGIGNLSINAHGRLDGLIRIAVVGVEHIVPDLGLDRAIERGIDRLAGANGASRQGPSTLDRLMPGLGDAVRETTNASLIENFKKMGQPTEIDNKPAILLPLRVVDGSVFLGLLPLGAAPPLF